MAIETLIFKGYEYARLSAEGDEIESGIFYDQLMANLHINERVVCRAIYVSRWTDAS